jgi:hypothetical protein
MERNMSQLELPANLAIVKIVKSLNQVQSISLIPKQSNFEG